jgi:hypothetical protein
MVYIIFPHDMMEYLIHFLLLPYQITMHTTSAQMDLDYKCKTSTSATTNPTHPSPGPNKPREILTLVETVSFLRVENNEA